MVYKFSDYLTIDDGNEIADLLLPYQNKSYSNSWTASIPKIKYFDSDIRIKIQDTWYDVIPLASLIRKRSSDGYYRAIYIWVNYDTGEYYIGKVNAANKNKFLSYKGSGVKFKLKYQKHKDRFARYYLYWCKSSKETEQIEAKIVNEELLKDPFCLNLIQGGGGISQAPFSEERRTKQSEYMKNHPERFKAMLDAAHSFDRRQIDLRNEKIRQTMSDEKHRKMSSDRIKRWRKENPEAYAKARENNRKSVNKPESKQKGVESRKKWIANNPDKYEIWQEHRKTAISSEKVRSKTSQSQKNWIKNHPEEAKRRMDNARKAFVEKASIPVEMFDLETRRTIKTFSSIKEAGDWLVDNNYTKSVNPQSMIGEVCSSKTIPGHGKRKSYKGFGWRYVDKQTERK